jgi:uroporphyrinogen-III synthase
MNPVRRRIWITRAAPGAEKTAERVRALGHDPLIHPLLEVQPVTPVDLDLSDVGALAFTSANGVRAFAQAWAGRELPVFAVGEATGQAARQAGFRKVYSTTGDVTALADGIAARRREIPGAILHPGAANPAGDLVGDLMARSVPARSVVLYQTAVRQPDAALLADLPGLDAVLVHSPRAAQALAQVLERHPAPQLRILAISPAALRPLADTPAAMKASPPFPLEAALLNLIDR